MPAHKIFINYLFLLFIIFCCSSSLQAAEQQKNILDSGNLEEIFSDIVMDNSPWPRKDLKITRFTARPKTLSLPAGDLDYQLLNQPHNEHLGKKTLSLALFVDGKETDRVKMTGDLQLYGDVICTTKRIDRHTILTPDDIKIVRRDISTLESSTLKSQKEAIGKRLKTSLRAGAVLSSNLIENPPLVKRGDLVTIMAQSNSLRVITQGEVRNTGALGEMVRVKNLMSRREIYARVLGSGVVETTF